MSCSIRPPCENRNLRGEVHAIAATFVPGRGARLSWAALAFAGLVALQAAPAVVPPPAVEGHEAIRERTMAHFADSAYAAAQAGCAAAPPVADDIEYRFACLASREQDPAPTIPALFDLHVDALSADNIDVAALSLSLAAWRQSAGGDIRSAFLTYERAMHLASEASQEVFADVTLNTATMYVMHGDPEYVKRGVELQQLAIRRFEEMTAANPANARGHDFGIALSQHNVGVAYALHLGDYGRALEWFARVDPENLEFLRSKLVFSALSAAELGRTQDARRWLAESLAAPQAQGGDTSYLACYQQLVRQKLEGATDPGPCAELGEQTPLEVNLDLHKRMADLSQPEWRLLGLEGLHRLFVDTLEPQLKQSSMHAASRTELSRLQMETKLQEQLVEKERALARAEQERLVGVRLLAGALVAILLLVILLVVLRLRHNRKLARHFRAMSVHDALTGLHNRRYFEHNIDREMSQARRARRSGAARTMALCLLDVDHFKRINDTHGHDVGDAVLVELARRLDAATRDSDIVVRWGGEEFLLLACLDGPGEMQILLERGRRLVADEPFVLPGGRSLDLTCTIGAAIYPSAGDEGSEVHWQRLVQLADAALYMGKSEGRNRWICIDDVHDAGVLEGDATLALAELERHGRVSITRSTEPAVSG